MDLKGAKIKNLYSLCSEITSDKEGNLNVNIPFYQRPFSWTEENIKQLYLDYINNFENTEITTNKEYFIGSLLTVEKDNAYDIIDGQQRLTTLYLINFVKFIVLRAYIVELLSTNRILSLEKLFDSLIKSSNYLFEIKTELFDLKNKILEKISTEEEDSIKEAKDIFMTFFNIRNLSQDNLNDFYKSQMSGLKAFMSDKELRLKYSRESHNKKLKESLSNCVVKLNSQEFPTIKFEEFKDESITAYMSAIKTIFNLFFQQTNANKNLSTKIKNKLDNLDDFLKNIQFCLIHTGHENDAYTLFEVLNDRAVALDDLDLVKNSFYKRYCELNKNNNIRETDKLIEELEGIWGDKVFNKNYREKEKKLTFYLGTCFLLGDNTLNYNDKDKKARKKIGEFLQNKNEKYCKDSIRKEFNIYKNVLTVLRYYEFPYQSKHFDLHKVENENENIIKKVLILLHYKEQYGVMAALINSILFKFEQKSSLSLEEFLDEIKLDNELLKISKNIWSLVLLSNDYKIPKSYSDNILTNNFLKNTYSNNCFYSPDISVPELTKAKIEFSYIKELKKGQDDKMLKFLFLLLMKFIPNNNGIGLSPLKGYYKFTDIKKLELDHFEPNNIDNSHPNYYFMPNNLDERNKHVQGIGNFILLDKKKNIIKGNTYSSKAFHFYHDSFGKNIWLINEMEDLFEKNCINDSGIKIPTIDFLKKEKRNYIIIFYRQLNYHHNKFLLTELLYP